MKLFLKKIWGYELTRLFAGSVLLNLIIECLSHRSLAGLLLPFNNPVIFAYNSFIIMFTLSLALLFKRRVFTVTMITLVWFLMGLINCIVLSARKTPFTAMDIFLIKDALKVIPVYINGFGIIMIIAGLSVAAAGLVLLWIKAPKYKGKINYLNNLIKAAFIALIVFLSSNMLTAMGILPNTFGNLADAYKRYGFAYCFSTSFISRGISKPNGYSSEYIDNIKKEIESGEQEAENDYPNIIFLQLESFMDPRQVIGAEFSENPVPVFEYLMNHYTSGYLSVPCIGAGTANTEFEIQTGMNLDHFGPGEYPYRTVMQNKTCESAAFNLKNLGFSTHAIHNNDGTFYDRNRVFANLGYDTFTSIEYMSEFEVTPLGWAKDKVLVGQINDALNSTEEEDYIFTISVQGHGDYPTVMPEGYTPKITVADNKNIPNNTAFEYYVNQLNEMDQFIGALIKELEDRDEKTILVMYGDHLPGFDFTEDMLSSGDIFKTQYVMWSNYDIPVKNRDVEAYQLSSYVLGRIGITEGIVTKFHQKQYKSEEYLKNLKVLEYDILYGNCTAYGGMNPFKPTKLKMGVKDIVIDDAYVYKESICVEGSNFNDYSTVMINGKEYDTEVISDHLLRVKNHTLKIGDVVSVLQKGTDKIELGRVEFVVGKISN